MAINKFGKSIEDLLGLTDSEDSSSSSSHTGVFDNQQPLILELHELKKDEPKSDNPAPEAKVKKIKKKKKSQAKSHISMSSSQSEGASVPPAADTTEDEFYDAHESYHALPDSQVPKPVTAAVGLLLAHSEHGQDPKATPEPPISPSAHQTTATPKAPLTITKPTTHPQ